MALREARHWAFVELLRGEARRVGEALAAAGGETIVIKGLHVVELAPTFADRPMRDGDVVVVGVPWQRVPAILRATGFAVIESAAGLLAQRPGLPTIDVHQSALPAGFGRLTTSALRARATPSGLVAPCLVPCLADAAALSLAHYVRDGLGRHGRSYAAADIRNLDAAGLTPEAARSRLRDVGLLSVGRVALVALARGAPHDEILQRWLRVVGGDARELARAERVARQIDRAATLHLYAAFARAAAIGDSAQASLLGVASFVRALARSWLSARGAARD